MNIVSTILLRNPELSFNQQVDLNKLIEDGFVMYCKDNELDTTDMVSFFAAHYSVTTGYLARSVVNNLLTGGCMTTTNIDSPSLVDEPQEMCNVT